MTIAYAYSPPKAVEQARKLVESDEVLLMFQPLGTPSNSAIQKYMNTKKVPQLFVATGATKFGDPQNFPWTMGWQPNYQSEGRIYAAYILKNYPNGKIAALWQNDDAGRDQMKGVRDGLGAKAGMIIADKSYEVADPTIDFADRGAETLRRRHLHDLGGAQGRGAGDPQGRRTRLEAGVLPRQRLATSVATVLKPAGLDNAKGIISTAYIKDPTDPAWKDDPGIKTWPAFMDKYFPTATRPTTTTSMAHATAQTMVQVLKQCGDDLTRENVMKQAASLKDFTSDVLLPGIKINTGPNDFFPIEQMQLMKFNGESWELFGDIIAGEVGH